MRFFSTVSESESSAAAVEEVIRDVRAHAGDALDVVFAFLTLHHVEEAEAMLEKLWLELDPQAVIGCSAEGVIGADREVERAPGLSLLVGEMPGVRLRPFHVPADEWRLMLTDPAALTERAGCGGQTRAIFGFADPFTTPLAQLLPAMDQVMPGSPLVGGMASAARSPGGNVLLKNDAVYTDGMVGLSVGGPVVIDTVVSQGCRPIGRAMVVTKARDNVVEQLGGKPALAALREMAEALPAEEMNLVRENGLLIGRAISEFKETFGRGDFLVRSLAGVDEKSGAIAVGDYVRTGQTVQFHVRDAGTAHEDLVEMLAAQSKRPAPAGALLFSCNGRGRNLFAEPSHDIGVSRVAMPDVPVAGFFAAGELGPVGGKNFVHGHTASFALLRPASSSASY